MGNSSARDFAYREARNGIFWTSLQRSLEQNYRNSCQDSQKRFDYLIVCKKTLIKLRLRYQFFKYFPRVEINERMTGEF